MASLPKRYNVTRLMVDGLSACRAAVDGTLPASASSYQDRLAYERLGFTGDWCCNGFPVVEIGHRLAAALMCTDPPDMVRVPWSTFLIYVPRELVLDLTHVLVRDRGDGTFVFVVCFGDTRAAVFRGSLADELKRLASDRLFASFDFERSSPIANLEDAVSLEDAKVSVDELRRRAILAAVQLFANVCATLERSTEHMRRIGKGYALPPFAKNTRIAGEPKTQLFRLGSPVQIDCRETVRAYMSGARRSKPKVQWIVRGHWTRQAHGPARALRRLQWIEPYWKGRDGMPINVRPHVMGAE